MFLAPRARSALTVVELRRHTDAEGDVLSASGVRAAVEIGRSLRHDPHHPPRLARVTAVKAQQTARTVSNSKFGSGTGTRTLNLAVNRSTSPFKSFGPNSPSVAECRQMPLFATGVAVRSTAPQAGPAPGCLTFIGTREAPATTFQERVSDVRWCPAIRSRSAFRSRDQLTFAEDRACPGEWLSTRLSELWAGSFAASQRILNGRR